MVVENQTISTSPDTIITLTTSAFIVITSYRCVEGGVKLEPMHIYVRFHVV